MASDLKLTQLHDLAVENGDFVIVKDLEETKQSFRIRIWFWRGEWVYNELQGVPWFDFMFDVSVSQEEKDRVIRNVLLGTEGAKAVLEYHVWIDDVAKSAVVYFRMSTIWGDGIIEERIAV